MRLTQFGISVTLVTAAMAVDPSDRIQTRAAARSDWV